MHIRCIFFVLRHKECHKNTNFFYSSSWAVLSCCANNFLFKLNFNEYCATPTPTFSVNIGFLPVSGLRNTNSTLFLPMAQLLIHGVLGEYVTFQGSFSSSWMRPNKDFGPLMILMLGLLLEKDDLVKFLLRKRKNQNFYVC